MKKTVALTLSLLLGTSVAFAASGTPVDNSAERWAYDAVKLLIKEGIVTGYDDTSFRAGKTISRSEMAQIVANAMANEEKANIAQKALIDKLAGEFALDMNKIENRSPKQAMKVDKAAPKSNIDLSGRLSTQYKMSKNSEESKVYGQVKISLDAEAKVDENTMVKLRLASPAPSTTSFKDSAHFKFGEEYADSGLKSTRFFAVTKIGEVKAAVGRQAMDIDPEGFLVDGEYFSFDGVGVSWDWNGLGFSVKRGRFAKGIEKNYGWGNLKDEFADVDIDSVMVDGKTGKLKWDVAWAKFTNPKENLTLTQYYFGNIDYAFTKKFALSAEYGKNHEATQGGDFSVLRGTYGDLKLNAKGKQNVALQLVNADKNALYYAYSAFDCPDEGATGDAFKSWDVTYKYAFSPNKIAKIERARITDKDDNGESYSFWKIGVSYKF